MRFYPLPSTFLTAIFAFALVVPSALQAQVNADLMLTMSASQDSITPGGLLSYTLEVTNNGPDDAQNVVVTDTLPSGVLFLASNLPFNQIPTGEFVCSVGTVANGAKVTLSILVQVAPGTTGQLNNEATVASEVPDDNLENNLASASVQVISSEVPENADLALSKTGSPNPVVAGGLLSYTLEVTNNGPDDAQNVVVTDTLPAGLEFVSSNLPCDESAEGGLICPLGDLAVGTTTTLSLFVQVSPDLTGLVENSATVDGETPDSNVENNLATASIEVNPPNVQISADLALEKSASASQIMPGDTFDYTLTVSNQGPNTATNVTLYDVLPQGLSLVSTNASCVGSTNLRCALGSVPVGESVVVLLSVQADAELPDIVLNTASVLSTDVPDPSTSNNQASFTVYRGDPPSGPLTLLPTDTVLPDAFVGQPYSAVFSGKGGQSPLSLTGVNPPPGTSFSAGPGNQLELSGVPTQLGNFAATLTLTDSGSPMESIVREYWITVAGELDIRPLSLPVTQVGDAFVTTFMTANGIPPENFTSIDPLPPGLVLSGNSLTGSPTAVGDFSFAIVAIDAVGSQGLRNYNLSVLPAGLLILTDSLPDGIVNSSYGTQLTAIGGIEPYRWRLDSTAPPGLTFSTAGFLSGRPTTPGIYPVVVTVVDQAGAEVSAELSLTVKRSDLASLSPEILPDGSIGVPYNVPILREGGIPPYKAEVIRGSLPEGLHLSRDGTAISGVPEEKGEFKFEIQVRDGSKPPLRTRRKHVLTID